MNSPRKLLLLALFSSGPGLRAGPIDVGGRPQLFIDRRFIAESSGIELRMNPPEKRGIVLAGDRPWDDYRFSSYGTVMEDGGKFRMWYGAASPHPATEDRVRGLICYAESDDGIHWRKPDLGLFEWHGSKANNILMEATLESSGVMIDPKAPPSERYKIVGRLLKKEPRSPDGEAPDGSGLYLYTSPDGLRWTLHRRKVFPFDPDTLNMALYDRRTGKYLAYVRTWNPLRRVGVDVVDDLMEPWPYDRSVPPRRAGGLPGPVNAPTRNIPDAFGTDAGDPPNLDFYTSAVVEYPWADDAYFMFPSAYRHYPDPPLGRFRNSGVLDIDLAVSRDGLAFHRISRLPYVGLGRAGTRDSRGVYEFIGMLRRDQVVYQYYAGHDVDHGDTVTPNPGAIFLAVQRLDGFVSADAGPEGGRFTTPLLLFRGRRLVLNLDASSTGEIKVEVEDAAGKPLEGHGFAESDPLFLNDVSRTATWRGSGSDLSALAGRPIRLSFRMRSAKLYSFRFSD